MYVCMYVCMYYVYVRTRVHACVCVYTHTHIYIYTHTYTRTSSTFYNKYLWANPRQPVRESKCGPWTVPLAAHEAVLILKTSEWKQRRCKLGNWLLLIQLITVDTIYYCWYNWLLLIQAPHHHFVVSDMFWCRKQIKSLTSFVTTVINLPQK